MENVGVYQVASENEFVRIVQVTLDAHHSASKYVPSALPMVRIIFESDDPRLPPGSTHYCEASPDDRPAAAMREVASELKSGSQSRSDETRCRCASILKRLQNR